MMLDTRGASSLTCWLSPEMRRNAMSWRGERGSQQKNVPPLNLANLEVVKRTSSFKYLA